MGGQSASTNPIAGIYTQQLENQQLPGTLQAIGKQIPGLAQQQYNATAQTQPLYNALNLSQLQQYALPLAQAGQQVQNSNALAGGATNLAQIQGSGGQAATAATNLNNTLNPVQAASNRQATNLVNSINLNGLSGGEQAAVERSLNQSNYATGNLGLDNATNAVSNAMNFGNALQSKRNALGSALQTAGGVAANQNAQVNPVNIALGQPNVSAAGNFGTSQFGNSNSSTSAGAASNAFGGASGLFNNISGLTSNQLSANQSAASGQTGLAGQLGSAAIGGACCFIVLESYHGEMPSFVRKARDKYYTAQPQISKGYRKVASFLVPKMKRFWLIRSLVWNFMVHPATEYFGGTLRRTGYSRTKLNRIITRFWLNIFYKLGK